MEMNLPTDMMETVARLLAEMGTIESITVQLPDGRRAVVDRWSGVKWL